MRTLGVLCLFHGVQSAALKGLLHKASLITDEPLEPPNYVVSGFMGHHDKTAGEVVASISNILKRRQWASAEDHKKIHDECQVACGKGVDSSCVPECQVRMYGCLDHDRKTVGGKKLYADCEKQVLDTYGKFGKSWEATHPYTTQLLVRSKGVVSAADIDQVQDDCSVACGKGVDTSCLPECQVKLYHCLDHDRKVPEGKKKYDTCEKEVLDTYRKFAADWDATHPYLLAVGAHTTVKALNTLRDECSKSSNTKSYAARCQTSMFTCLHASSLDYATCAAGAKAKVAKAEAAWYSKQKMPVDELAQVDKACTSSCGLGVDASCVPECAVQMYSCSSDTQDSKAYTACTKKVVKSYETLAFGWNDAHPFLINHRAYADADSVEEIRDECVEACGKGVDTSCVPECQVKMYTCLDHDRKVAEGAKKYKKCSQGVLATYERFADDWDKTHPYLLAVHRHVGTVELVHVADKCVDACGAGVDSSCLPECQVEMYGCLDHDRKTKEGAELYDECERKAVAEYKEFGKNWDAAHPYGAK